MGAVEFQTMRPGKRVISWPDFVARWNDLKNEDGPLICTNSNTFTELKKLWQDCVTNGACLFVTEGEQQQVNEFFSTVDSVTPGGNQ